MDETDLAKTPEPAETPDALRRFDDVFADDPWGSFEEEEDDDYEDRRSGGRGRGGRGLLIVLLVLVLLLALGITAWFVFPVQRDQLIGTVLSLVGMETEPGTDDSIKPLAFEIESTNSEEDKTTVVFRVVTTTGVSHVELRDNSGAALDTRFTVVQAD